MPRWLAEASKRLNPRRGSSHEPVPFEVPCSCGRQVHGMRGPRYQQVVCQVCGNRLFVLPEDVYPQPKPPRNRRKKPTGPAEKPAAGKKKSRTKKRHGVSLLKGLQTALAAMASRLLGGVRWLLAQPKAFLTPFRLVMLTILIVVAATIGFTVRQNTLQQARQTLQASRQKGATALRQGEFVVAEEQLRRACAALDVLGRNDPSAREIRQMGREARAGSHLAERSLYGILQEAQDALSRGHTDWQENFRRNYAGSWIVMETTLTHEKQASGESRWRLDYPLQVGGKPVVLPADWPLFEQSSFQEDGRPVIVAAQLKDLRLTDASSPSWVIEFRRQSAFLWSHFATYRHLAFGTGEMRNAKAVRELLQQQAAVMERTP